MRQTLITLGALFTMFFAVPEASAFYNPELGRWESRDPIGEQGGIGIYNSGGNNPGNRLDPLGLDPLGNEWYSLAPALPEPLQSVFTPGLASPPGGYSETGTCGSGCPGGGPHYWSARIPIEVLEENLPVPGWSLLAGQFVGNVQIMQNGISQPVYGETEIVRWAVSVKEQPCKNGCSCVKTVTEIYAPAWAQKGKKLAVGSDPKKGLIWQSAEDWEKGHQALVAKWSGAMKTYINNYVGKCVSAAKAACWATQIRMASDWYFWETTAALYERDSSQSVGSATWAGPARTKATSFGVALSGQTALCEETP